MTRCSALGDTGVYVCICVRADGQMWAGVYVPKTPVRCMLFWGRKRYCSKLSRGSSG